MSLTLWSSSNTTADHHNTFNYQDNDSPLHKISTTRTSDLPTEAED